MTLKETAEGFKIIDVYDPEDWFTEEYEEEGFDYDALMEDYTGEEPVETEVISEPEETIEELKGYGLVHGVILDICESGNSSRYSG